MTAIFLRATGRLRSEQAALFHRAADAFPETAGYRQVQASKHLAATFRAREGGFARGTCATSADASEDVPTEPSPRNDQDCKLNGAATS